MIYKPDIELFESYYLLFSWKSSIDVYVCNSM